MTTDAEVANPNRWRILAVLAAVAFMAQLDLFIVNVALPSMAQSFHGAGLSSLSWVLNAYAIVFAALLVPAGRLADHFGRRRFLLAGVAVFTLARRSARSLPSLAVLVGARAVQALGAAMIVPTSLGLLCPSFPRASTARSSDLGRRRRGRRPAGPTIGGLLVGLNWRWIFLINLPIGIATMIAGRRVAAGGSRREERAPA